MFVLEFYRAFQIGRNLWRFWTLKTHHGNIMDKWWVPWGSERGFGIAIRYNIKTKTLEFGIIKGVEPIDYEKIESIFISQGDVIRVDSLTGLL